ncbi:MAG: hypothetical protein IJ790_00950 [Lachnospiraceae bacterium]|nr:hypothetical protein [Lachnospiraceae bacterium]
MGHVRLGSFYSGGAKKPLQVIFTSSQTYTIPSGYKSMDVFVVGGGSSGASTPGEKIISSDIIYGSGSAGGGGGYTKTQTLIGINKNTLSITIGSGGIVNVSRDTSHEIVAGGTTQILSGTTVLCQALGGQKNSSNSRFGGGNGGSGGGGAGKVTAGSSKINSGNGGSNGGNGGAGASSSGVGQGRTTRAFDEDTGTLYAGGGGGGGYGTSAVNVINGNGGAGGGTTGGFHFSSTSDSAGANTGGGAGGGARVPSGTGGYIIGKAGNGGSGIAIVRLFGSKKRPTIIWDATNTINL